MHCASGLHVQYQVGHDCVKSGAFFTTHAPSHPTPTKSTPLPHLCVFPHRYLATCSNKTLLVVPPGEREMSHIKGLLGEPTSKNNCW
jgi:hypothetical protein